MRVCVCARVYVYRPFFDDAVCLFACIGLVYLASWNHTEVGSKSWYLGILGGSWGSPGGIPGGCRNGPGEVPEGSRGGPKGSRVTLGRLGTVLINFVAILGSLGAGLKAILGRLGAS